VRDQRLDKLANVIVDYSVKVQPGELVRLVGDPVAEPLLEALYEKLIRVGANVVVRSVPSNFREIFLRTANDDQLQHVCPLAKHEVETIDVSIGLFADTNTKALSNIDPKRQATASASQKVLMQRFMERSTARDNPEGHPGVKPLRWVGTMFPTQAAAQDAEMSLTDYESFVFGGGFLDRDDPIAEWTKLKDQQQKLTDYLNGRREVHFQTPNGTDLRVSCEGMTWINCFGDCNFPDGEVFTGPNLNAADGGVNGRVRYTYPAVYRGREVEDVELVFEGGRVVEARASKNEDYLIEMLDQDEGARSVGEVALGTNYNIQQFTKSTLFDEKIGGTFHIAVGAGYPETGNANESALHWDMVCDLRHGGTVTVDGEVISRDGQFVFDGWPGR